MEQHAHTAGFAPQPHPAYLPPQPGAAAYQQALTQRALEVQQLRRVSEAAQAAQAREAQAIAAEPLNCCGNARGKLRSSSLGEEGGHGMGDAAAGGAGASR